MSAYESMAQTEPPPPAKRARQYRQFRSQESHREGPRRTFCIAFMVNEECKLNDAQAFYDKWLNDERKHVVATVSMGRGNFGIGAEAARVVMIQGELMHYRNMVDQDYWNCITHLVNALGYDLGAYNVLVSYCERTWIFKGC